MNEFDKMMMEMIKKHKTKVLSLATSQKILESIERKYADEKKINKRNSRRSVVA